MKLSLCHVGVATVLITIDDVTFINDPCFDEGGHWYHHGFGAFSKKTDDPRLGPDELPTPDVGLITHDHHEDNFDQSGRKFLESVPNVISTNYSDNTLDTATALHPGDSTSFTVSETTITVKAVTARHGLGPLAWLVGPVNGYVVEYGSDPLRIYVSGDTVFSTKIAEEVQSIGDIDLFVPHLGNAYFPYLSGPLRYTMNREDLKKFIDELEPTYTYPIHNEGWSHFRPVDVDDITEIENKTTLRTEPECEIELGT